MKKIVLILLSFLSVACLADEVTVGVSNVSCRQRYPWNGLVDIDCDVSCNDAQAPILLTLNAWDEVANKSLEMRHVWLEGDQTRTNALRVTAGKCRVVWDADADAPNTVSDNVTIKVQAYEIVDTEVEDYLVVDLSGGTSATRYPVTALSAVPQGGWTEEYKTEKLVLRLIRPSSFTMGSPTDELGRGDDETPHEVMLTKPYYMGVFEITQRQWELVMGSNPSSFKGNDRPVENVSYDMICGASQGALWPNSSTVDATSFIGRVREKTGLEGLDLPTEAQWEYACRAGTETSLNSGMDIMGDTVSDVNMKQVGRYSGNVIDGKGGYADHQTAVGSYQPNAWGLYDMHGNVWEWCRDRYGAYPTGSETVDPVGAPVGTSDFVIRGGGWNVPPSYCRSAKRFGSYASSSIFNFIGFRLSGFSSASAAAPIVSEAAFRLDTRTGVRTVKGSEAITYSPRWASDKGESVTSGCHVAVDGTESLMSGVEGSFMWSSLVPGTHCLTHTAGSVVYTAQFVVPDWVRVANVISSQRQVWSGLVDIDCEILCSNTQTNLTLSLSAKDLTTGSEIPMSRVWLEGDATQTNALVVTAGKHRLVWDAGADAPDFVSGKVAITVQATIGVRVQMPAYLVVDLSNGPSAASYPVQELAAVPQGGWTDEYKTDKLVLRLIRPGTYTMGCERTEVGYNTSFDLFEALPHKVTITRPFYIGVFEVTQRQWELVMGTRPSYFSNSSCYQTRPVEQVSWNMIRGNSSIYTWPNVTTVDSASFIGRLRARTGLEEFDLPTEGQWEYACRAGTTTSLNNGKNLTGASIDVNLNEIGRYINNYPSGSTTYSITSTTDAGTAAVGSYQPNDWGLYDMLGNVYEWCLDFWQYRSEFTSAATDPTGPSSGTERSTRGGAWGAAAATCRSAYRVGASPSSTRDLYGFRLSKALPASEEFVEEAAVTGQATGAPMWLDTRGGSIGKTELPVPVFSPLTYTGEAQGPEIDGGTLFSVIGNDRWTEVGDHEIVFVLKNPFEYRWAGVDDLFATATFSIVPASLTDEMVGLVPEQIYLGAPLEPEVRVAGKGSPLVCGVDYTLAYADNDAVGEGRVIVSGKGNYAGTIERTFPIVRTDGVAEFTASAFAAAEGEKAVVKVRGGSLDQATSVQVVAVYNTALATDLVLKEATVNGEAVKSFKFPVTLAWAKGEIGEKTIELPIVSDRKLEAGEFFTLQLLNPLNMRLADGMKSVCTVSIADSGYDAAKAKVAEGTATKAETNDVVRADKVFAGKIYVRALAEDAARGKTTGSALVTVGKKVTLKATANKGFVFVGWYEGGTLVSRLASCAFTAPEQDLTLFAKFVTVEEDAASLATGVNGVSLDAAEASFATNVMAGVYLQWPLATEALSQTTVTVAGLPTGLKFTAKDVVDAKTKQVKVPANTIYGAPTAASKVNKKSGEVVPSSVKVTVTTAGKTKRVYTLALTVDAMPAWAVGTFNGPALAGEAPNGLATLTIAQNGKVSGKLLAEGLTWSLAAASFTDYSPTAGFTATVIGTRGKQAFTNELTVTSGPVGGLAQGESFAAVQNTWKVEPWKARAATFAQVAPVVVAVAGDQPGEIALKFASSGAVTVAGAFKTGVDAKGKDVVTKVTCATVVCPDGDPDATDVYGASVFVYFPPKGAFAGYCARLRLCWDGTGFVLAPLP